MVRVPYFFRVLVVFGYITAQIGFPILETPDVADDSPYPCRGHQCGCRSAEACWQNCCCFSLSQRLAWADQHDIAIPANWVSTPIVAQHHVTDEGSANCCDAKGHGSGHRSEIGHSGKSCTKPTAPNAAHRGEGANPHGSRTSLAIQSLKCHGHASYWLVASEPALATDASMSCRFEFAIAGSICFANEYVDSWGDVPPVPPG